MYGCSIAEQAKRCHYIALCGYVVLAIIYQAKRGSPAVAYFSPGWYQWRL